MIKCEDPRMHSTDIVTFFWFSGGITDPGSLTAAAHSLQRVYDIFVDAAVTGATKGPSFCFKYAFIFRPLPNIRTPWVVCVALNITISFL